MAVLINPKEYKKEQDKETIDSLEGIDELFPITNEGSKKIINKLDNILKNI